MPPKKRRPSVSPSRAQAGPSSSTQFKSPELHRSFSNPAPGRLGEGSTSTDRGIASPQLGHKTIIGRSTLRNELSEGEGMGSWTKDKFVETATA